MQGHERNPWWGVAALFAAASLSAGASRAADNSLLQQAHAWGRFGKGSWRHARIITDNFDENGSLTNTSVTDNKTTVEEVTPDRVTLRVEVTVEVAGQKFPSQPQLVKQGYAGENAGQTASRKPLPKETLTIDGREIACETEQIEILGGASKEVCQISYAPDLTPPILKRKSTVSDAASAKTTQETLSEVYALEMPYKVLEERKAAFWVKQVQRNEHGVTTTWSINVPEVPGEVVAHSSKKLDDKGRLVRRSTFELIGYGAEENEAIPVRARGRRAKRNR